MYKDTFTPDKAQTLEDIHAIIDLLYITQCRATKNALLNRLRRLVAQLAMAVPSGFDGNVIPVDTFSQSPPLKMPPDAVQEQPPRPLVPQIPQKAPGLPRMQNTQPHGNQQETQPPAKQQRLQVDKLKAFTLEELARYDGKGGNPAYVAVNGIVYDVTDEPGWAAGSHFGLRAGLDQTSAYISCHTGQPMIDQLKAIGRLVK